MRTADPTRVPNNAGRWRSLFGGVAAAVGAAFSVAGLLRIGLPLLLPFIVMAVAAVGAWAASWRSVAVGIVVGTLAWSAFIVLAILAMGDAMEGFN